MRNKFRFLFAFILGVILNMQTVLAGEIGSSKLAKGTEKLIGDATTWALIVAPIITILVVIYFFIRKGMSEEHDHKRWNDRVIVAIVSCVFAVLASVVVNLVLGYYK